MASEAPGLRDDYGRKLHVGRTQDGEFCVSITDGLRSVMAVLSGERLTAFRDAVGPVCSEPGPHELHICAEGHTPAMPGQPAAAATEADGCARLGCGHAQARHDAGRPGAPGEDCDPASGCRGWVQRVLLADEAGTGKTTECPQPGCKADPATASGGLPPKWCTGDCSHGDGEPEAGPTAEQVRRCGDSEDPSHQCPVCFDYAAQDYRPTQLKEAGRA